MPPPLAPRPAWRSSSLRRALLGRRWQPVGGLFLLFDELLALIADEQILPRLFIEPRQIVVEERVLHHAPSRFRPEIVFRVEPVDPLHQFSAIETGVHH